MKEYTILTNSAQQTIDWACAFAKKLDKGIVITLEGQLASGKTTFAKGFGKGLNIEQPINSPTFTISKIYEGTFPLIHIDAYRLEGIDQELGFEEFFDPEWMVLIEWPQYIEHLLPKERIAFSFTVVDDHTRSIKIEAPDRYASVIKELL